MRPTVGRGRGGGCTLPFDRSLEAFEAIGLQRIWVVQPGFRMIAGHDLAAVRSSCRHGWRHTRTTSTDQHATRSERHRWALGASGPLGDKEEDGGGGKEGTEARTDVPGGWEASHVWAQRLGRSRLSCPDDCLARTPTW